MKLSQKTFGRQPSVSWQDTFVFIRNDIPLEFRAITLVYVFPLSTKDAENNLEKGPASFSPCYVCSETSFRVPSTMASAIGLLAKTPFPIVTDKQTSKLLSATNTRYLSTWYQQSCFHKIDSYQQVRAGNG